MPLPDADGGGILVRLPVEDLAYGQLAAVYNDWRYLGNRLRAKHSIRAAQSALELIDASTEEVSASFQEHTDALLADLTAEFSSEISSRSPQHLLDRINSLSN